MKATFRSAGSAQRLAGFEAKAVDHIDYARREEIAEHFDPDHNEAGVCSAGFTTTHPPAASAGAIFQVPSAAGISRE